MRTFEVEVDVWIPKRQTIIINEEVDKEAAEKQAAEYFVMKYDADETRITTRCIMERIPCQ